jgi:hypothetical protein
MGPPLVIYEAKLAEGKRKMVAIGHCMEQSSRGLTNGETRKSTDKWRMSRGYRVGSGLTIGENSARRTRG